LEKQAARVQHRKGGNRIPEIVKKSIAFLHEKPERRALDKNCNLGAPVFRRGEGERPRRQKGRGSEELHASPKTRVGVAPNGLKGGEQNVKKS